VKRSVLQVLICDKDLVSFQGLILKFALDSYIDLPLSSDAFSFLGAELYSLVPLSQMNISLSGTVEDFFVVLCFTKWAHEQDIT